MYVTAGVLGGETRGTSAWLGATVRTVQGSAAWPCRPPTLSRPDPTPLPPHPHPPQSLAPPLAPLHPRARSLKSVTPALSAPQVSFTLAHSPQTDFGRHHLQQWHHKSKQTADSALACQVVTHWCASQGSGFLGSAVCRCYHELVVLSISELTSKPPPG